MIDIFIICIIFVFVDKEVFFSLTPPPLYLYWLPIQQFPAGPCAMLLSCENSNIGPSAVYIYYRI